jgi:hypothetical protein
MLVYKFIETELTTYIQDNLLTYNQELIKIICKAFEAYDEYKKLMTADDNLNRLSDTNFRMSPKFKIPDCFD